MGCIIVIIIIIVGKVICQRLRFNKLCIRGSNQSREIKTESWNKSLAKTNLELIIVFNGSSSGLIGGRRSDNFVICGL